MLDVRSMSVFLLPMEMKVFSILFHLVNCRNIVNVKKETLSYIIDLARQKFKFMTSVTQHPYYLCRDITYTEESVDERVEASVAHGKPMTTKK